MNIAMIFIFNSTNSNYKTHLFRSKSQSSVFLWVTGYKFFRNLPCSGKQFYCHQKNCRMSTFELLCWYGECPSWQLELQLFSYIGFRVLNSDMILFFTFSFYKKVLGSRWENEDENWEEFQHLLSLLDSFFYLTVAGLGVDVSFNLMIVISVIFQNEFACATGVLLSRFISIFSSVLSKHRISSCKSQVCVLQCNLCQYKVPRQKARSGQTYHISPWEIELFNLSMKPKVSNQSHNKLSKNST